MKILFLCTEYAVSEGHSWLIDSLAEELAADHEVVAVVADWAGRYKHDFHAKKNGVSIYVYTINVFLRQGKIGRLLKWYVAPRAILWRARRLLKSSDFDIVINFSPAVIMAPMVKAFGRRAFNYLVLWDFFPIYHHELGLLPKISVPLLKGMENSAYNFSSRIGVMSPGNLNFLTKNYRLDGSVQAEVLYLWGPNDIVPRVESLYHQARLEKGFGGELICVFGGQLVKGRGLHKLLDLAMYVKNSGLNARFFVFGDGPEKDDFLREVRDKDLADWIFYMGFRPRGEYLRFLAAADLGLVFNSGTVTVPTIPSKTIDFFRAGLPILAFIEDASDYKEFLENKAMGGWCITPNFEEQLYTVFSDIVNMSGAEREQVGRNGQNWYIKNMTVEKIAGNILSSFSEWRLGDVQR